jgi:chitin synthase
MYGMPMVPQHSGSVYGMLQMGMGMGTMGPMGGMMGPMPPMGGELGGTLDGGSQFGGTTAGGMGHPMSTFSMLNSGPSQSTNPTDEELVNALRLYLGTQDLMTVTKK